MFGNPKYHLCLFLANVFSNFRHVFFQKGAFSSKTIVFSCISWLCLFLKTPNRQETQFHAWGWSIFDLNSHLDPIGDQNDVWYVGLCLVFVCVPTPVYPPPSPPGPHGGGGGGPRRFGRPPRISLGKQHSSIGNSIYIIDLNKWFI